MNGLFSALQLRGFTLTNRIAVPPMCQHCAVDGLANSWHVAHLTQLAISGAGMLTIEPTAVEPDGRVTPGDLGLWSDETEAAFGAVIRAIRDNSRIPVTLQLAHAGRKAFSYEPWHISHEILPENTQTELLTYSQVGRIQ